MNSTRTVKPEQKKVLYTNAGKPMEDIMRNRIVLKFKATLSILGAAFLALSALSSRAADTLPSQLSDAAYWKMISDFSEPDGSFILDFFTSNEQGQQYVLPQLTKSVAPGGVYVGVGPEQNFTYIAALRPKIAFIVDIRRDIMLEHLMYKAIFEMSADRADFAGNLFSRKRPAGLTVDSTVQAIFQAYAPVRGEPDLAEAHLKEILARLKTAHRFTLSDSDENRIRVIYMTFFSEGLRISSEGPDYPALMTLTDADGRNWNFLASRENYDRVRAMHAKNLIIPLVGDFAGPKALRMTGQYLRDHGAIVNVFYVSNVENYLKQTWNGWTQNVASLPVDASSLFIRWSLGNGSASPNWLDSIADFVRTGNLR